MLHLNNQGSAGIWVEKGKVIEVEDLSGQPSPFDDSTMDLAFRIKIDIGRSFTRDLTFSAKAVRSVLADGSEEITGTEGHWGKMMEKAFLALGIKNPDFEPNGALKQETKDAMIGKEVLTLRYVTGKKADGTLNWKTYQEIVPATLGEGAFKTKFLKRFKASGYPKDYWPEATA